MDELLAALKAALDEAGVEIPENPHSLTVGDLDNLVPDKRLRGKCKSALTKLKRAAGVAGGVAAAETPAEPTPEPMVIPKRAEAAEATPEPLPDPVPAPAPEPEPEEAAEPETPMSEALAERFAAVQAAFAAAGAEVPADPAGSPLEALDEAVEDRKLRAQCKSALVKFRRLAEEEGWRPAGTPRARPSTAAAGGDTAAEADGAAAESHGIPVPPVAAPADLYLLRGGAWQKLGTATREPSQADEIVGDKTEAGALRRINSILILSGKFEVPEDLYNTVSYVAHEGTVYKAYYISHIGDVRRGERTASLKVHATYDAEAFADAYRRTGDTPTADRQRLARFGERYGTPDDMFAERVARMI